MLAADFVEANRDQLIERWKTHVVNRLGRTMDESQLIDDLPGFLDDMVATLRSPSGDWRDLQSAEHHGRQRVKLGVDIAGLTEEMAILEESIVELARDQGVDLSSTGLQRLIKVMGEATALAVRSHAALHEKQRGDDLAQHYAFIAHQIRNPLGSASLIAEILAMVPEDQREGHIARLRRALSRLSKLVDDFVIDARLHGGLELSPRSVPVEKMVEQACEEVSAHAAEREVRIERDIEALEWEVEPELMASALTNLLSNAVKFNCRGGRIGIQARLRDGRVHLEVEDQCGELPADFRERMFQPVQKREHRTGYGLGLSLVKDVVEAHHGTIDVACRNAQGCTFVLDIPRRQGD